jgi:hypothetical protein
MTNLLLAAALLLAAEKPAATPTSPALTLKTPATMSATFSTLKLYAFSVDLDAGKARTAFQSWDEKAEKHWTGYVVLVETDGQGSSVSRSDGKKGTCDVTLAQLLDATPKHGLVPGVSAALFAKCVDSGP